MRFAPCQPPAGGDALAAPPAVGNSGAPLQASAGNPSNNPAGSLGMEECEACPAKEEEEIEEDENVEEVQEAEGAEQQLKCLL